MSQLLEIQPSRELKFEFEVKKQSFCNVQLINRTDQYVAFKVKTTSPKKYCVRPNVGVVLPKETCEFVVIMQAQRSPPTDMICKDKFLVQSTIVPAGTMEENVTSDMFIRGGEKYVEERKLKVIILSPPHSPELSPMNGKIKQVPPVESSVVADDLLSGTEGHSLHHLHQDVEDAAEIKSGNKEAQKPTADARLEAFKKVETELTKATEPVIKKDVESIPMEAMNSNPVDKLEAEPVIRRDVESRPIEIVESNPVKLEATPVIIREVEVQPIKVAESNPVDLLKARPVIRRDLEVQPIEEVESKSVETLEANPVLRRDVEFQPIEVVESKSVEKLEAKSVKRIEPRMVKEADKLRLEKDVEEMKTKLLELDSKLGQAEKTISKLMDESRSSVRERQRLEQQLALLKTPMVQKTVHEGFPLLFLCMVAIISIVIGYLFRR